MAQLYIVGGARLRRTFKQAGGNMKDLKALNREAAGIVADASKPLAPVDSGKLKRSIRPYATTRAGVVRAGSKRLPYGGVANYGWPAHNREATHFINEAAQLTEHTWVNLYWSKLNKELSKVKGI
ncbi:hypothetical protein ACIOJF_02505 [Glutamicibacter sp. NPDC087831]|uniref:hypothetical protein n=1 Tax=Glutamicibacter sp. NPDC087831 TaxID=3363998 RepID=UPI0038137DAC